MIVAWLHTVWFLQIQIYTKTQENLCIFWNRREKLTYLSSYVCFWYTKIGTAQTEKNSVSRHFVNFSFVITGKRHDMMVNNELWHTPMTISFKYMKDLQALKAWNGSNMYYNMTMSELKKQKFGTHVYPFLL